MEVRKTCVAVCCRVSLCVVVCCSALYSDLRKKSRREKVRHMYEWDWERMKYVHCNKLQHTATHCSTLKHTATHCNSATIRTRGFC